MVRSGPRGGTLYQLVSSDARLVLAMTRGLYDAVYELRALAHTLKCR